MCKDDNTMLIDEDNNTENVRGINDPIKLRRLNARMSTPNQYYGPNPAPRFLGYQEFFKEFIDYSCSPIFHQCLKDSFSHEIEKVF